MNSLDESRVYDLVIVGGGVLGASLAYWLSVVFESEKILLLDKEDEVGFHTSSRNTGIIHRPFYINPKERPIFAKFCSLSYDFWKNFASLKKLPWVETGTLKVALTNEDIPTLQKYQKWADENGMKSDEIELLDKDQVKKIEPNVKSAAALLCKTEASVNFGFFTKSLKDHSISQGINFLGNKELSEVDFNNGDFAKLKFKDGTSILTKFVINCAGNGSLKVAKIFNSAKNLTNFYFRGDYWLIKEKFKGLAKRNIYSVPKNSKFPFLDPHWIVRWDGSVEIGPNAMPVFSPNHYSGFPKIKDTTEWILDKPLMNKLKIFTNIDFLKLFKDEWKSSLFKKEITARIKKFLPKIDPTFLGGKGFSGIRNLVVNEKGEFLTDLVELHGPLSFHVLNYSSPGATGAPAYTASLLKKLMERGHLNHLMPRKNKLKETADFLRLSV